MDGLKALFNSEKALAGFALIIAATVLCAIGKMSIDLWVELSKWVFAFYVGGKTVQGAIAALAPAPMSTDEAKADLVAKTGAVKELIDHAVKSGIVKPEDAAAAAQAAAEHL